MKHAFIDNYADLDAPLQRIAAKPKVIFLLIFLPLLVLTPIRYKAVFLFYAAAAVILLAVSRLPLGFILKRILELAPFIIIASLSALFKKDGLLLFLNYTLKAILAVFLVLLVSATTGFSRLLQALKELKAPGVFILLLSFIYRYSFLLEDQFLRARYAYKSRSINGLNKFRKARILSNILASIFIRTYERAERVYLAMCARGYDYEKGD